MGFSSRSASGEHLHFGTLSKINSSHQQIVRQGAQRNIGIQQQGCTLNKISRQGYGARRSANGCSLRILPSGVAKRAAALHADTKAAVHDGAIESIKWCLILTSHHTCRFTEAMHETYEASTRMVLDLHVS